MINYICPTGKSVEVTDPTETRKSVKKVLAYREGYSLFPECATCKKHSNRNKKRIDIEWIKTGQQGGKFSILKRCTFKRAQEKQLLKKE
jgi:hypothetical protein